MFDTRVETSESIYTFFNRPHSPMVSLIEGGGMQSVALVGIMAQTFGQSLLEGQSEEKLVL